MNRKQTKENTKTTGGAERELREVARKSVLTASNAFEFKKCARIGKVSSTATAISMT